MRTSDIDGLTTRIRVPKTSELVANKIRAQIIRGDLDEGSFLPPEGQLMESLGISRPTLREAFRILEAEGLISVVRGSRTGAQVHRPSVELVSRYAGYVMESQGTTVADLYQARLAIEPSVVRWLATDKGGGTTDLLHRVIADLTTALNAERYDEFIDTVELFHQALVLASGCKTLTFMNRMLLNLAGHHQRELHRRLPEVRQARVKGMRTGIKSFQKLVALIEAGKVEEAVEHWRLHLRHAIAAWTGGGEGERLVDSLGA